MLEDMKNQDQARRFIQRPPSHLAVYVTEDNLDDAALFGDGVVVRNPSTGRSWVRFDDKKPAVPGEHVVVVDESTRSLTVMSVKTFEWSYVPDPHSRT